MRFPPFAFAALAAITLCSGCVTRIALVETPPDNHPSSLAVPTVEVAFHSRADTSTFQATLDGADVREAFTVSGDSATADMADLINYTTNINSRTLRVECHSDPIRAGDDYVDTASFNLPNITVSSPADEILPEGVNPPATAGRIVTAVEPGQGATITLTIPVQPTTTIVHIESHDNSEAFVLNNAPPGEGIDVEIPAGSPSATFTVNNVQASDGTFFFIRARGFDPGDRTVIVR